MAANTKQQSKGASKRERKRQALAARRKLEKRQSKRSSKEEAEIAALEQAIAAGAPPPGTNPLAIDAPLPGSYAGARTFEELPISAATRDGLKQANYVTLTAIQRAALPHSLAGRDVLGAAKTGSGKTLAFLIPVRFCCLVLCEGVCTRTASVGLRVVAASK